MHVLLLAYHYPPDPAVGSLRPAKVARAFREAGHRVTVITARLPGETAAVRETSDGLDVRTVLPIPNPREFYKLAKGWLRPAAGAHADGSGAAAAAQHGEVGLRENEAQRDVPTWKRAIFSLLWLPDDRQGFIAAAVSAAYGLMRHEPVDVLYTSAPPFSTQVAGLVLKATTGVSWAAEFRDPWTSNPFKPATVRTSFSDGAERWMERQTVRTANWLVAVSQGIADELEELVADDERDKLLLIRNGIDRLLPPRPAGGAGAPGRPLRIVHAGTFYGQRDPRPFFEALAAVRRTHGLGREQVEVLLLGRSRRFHAVDLEVLARELGIDDLVEFRDWVPQAEARALIESADLLLLLAQEQPVQVPNKLYDYLGTRAPILAFVDAEGESARLLQRVGGHYVVTENDTDAARRALEAALTAAERGGGDGARAADDAAVLEEWTTERQMRRLVSAVGG